MSAGQYDAKADIWSIGCIFYEMLAGQPPFGGVNEADLLNNIRTRELRAPGDISAASVSILKRVSGVSVRCIPLFLFTLARMHVLFIVIREKHLYSRIYSRLVATVSSRFASITTSDFFLAGIFVVSIHKLFEVALVELS